MKCSNCGFENPGVMKFCGNCGKSLSPAHTPSEEFRLLAVLFMDMVGYTSFSDSMDPEMLKDILIKYYQKIEADINFYDGEVIKYIGDGVLSVFGYPKSHENDPERAVLSALRNRGHINELNKNMSLGIKFRYGINYGRVVVSRVRDTMDFFGEEINIAQRLQAGADPEQILVSSTVFKQLKSIFDFKSSPRMVRITDGTETEGYQVLDRKKKRGKIRGVDGISQIMIGRREELEKLMTAFSQTLEDKKPRILLIEGEAGIGKTRLYDEFESGIKGSASTVIMKGRCLPYTRGFSYWPVMEIVKEYLGISADDSRESAINKIEEKINYMPEKESLYLADIKSLLLNFLGFIDAGDMTVPQDKIKRLFFIVFEEILRNLSREKLIIFVIEDFQWLDIPSRDLLLHITEHLRDTGMLFVFITRMEAKENPVSAVLYEKIRKLPGFSCIRLERLSESQSVELIERILETENLSADFRDLITGKSSGNPYYLEEIIKAFIESGVLAKEAGRWKITGRVKDVSIPSSVKGVIQARLDRLTHEERETIQNAAVIGNTFWKDVLDAITGIIVDRHLESLETKDYVIKNLHSEYFSHSEYLFRHILIREVAYDSLLSRARKSIHAKIARCIEKRFLKNDQYLSLLSYHYEKAGIYDKAGEYYHQLGMSQREKNLDEDALYSFEKVLEYGDSIDFSVKYSALDNMGKIRIIRGQSNEAISIYQQLLDSGKLDEKQKAENMCKLAEIYQRVSDYNRAEEYLEKIKEILNPEWFLESISYYSLKAYLGYLRGNTQQFISCVGTVQDMLKTPFKAPSKAVSDAVLLQSYLLLGAYYGIINQKKESLKYYKRIEHFYKSKNKYLCLDACYNNIGATYFSMGELGKAVRYFEKSIEICRKLHDRLGETVTCYNLGNIYLFCNYPEKAEQYFNRYLEINSQINNILGNGYGKSGLARLALRNGDYENAMALLKESKKIFSDLKSRVLAGNIDIQMAEACIDKGDLEDAEKLIKLIDPAENRDALEFLRGRIIHRKGDFDKAYPFFRSVYDRDIEKNDQDHLLTAGYYLLNTARNMKDMPDIQEQAGFLKAKVRAIKKALNPELRSRFAQDKNIRYILSCP